MRKIYLLIIFLLSAITYTEAQCSLVCNDNVIVTLDYNCQHQITIDDVLESPGPASCYTLEVYDEYGNFFPGTILDGSLLGQTIGVKVILANGNFCESWVIVRETHAPVFNCAPDITLKCYGTGGGLPPVYDNCDPNPQIILLSDNYVNLPCSSPFTGERSISYKAIDASGNESDICTQTIHYERADLDDVYFPLDRDGSPLPPLDCDNTYWDTNGNGYPDPSEVGVPTIDGVPLYPSQFCDLWVDFSDLIWPLNCGTKIMRTWTITDECSGEQVSAAQIIKLTSTSAPTLTCPGDQTVHASGVDCQATDVVLPTIQVSGGCGGTGSYTVSIPGYSVVFNGTHWVAKNLPAGVYYVTYTGSSTCGSGTSTCTIKLTVLEGGGNGPIPICDQNTVVSIGGNGKARVYASTFNDGSYDDCGPITIKVRRMNPGNCPPDVIDDTQFRDFIEVCCDDIASGPVQVVLQVTNSQGQKNQCMVLVHVQDKLPPTIYCPPNITIDCDYNFDVNNLSEFGRVVTDASDRRDIYINGQYVGRDGLATDNCNVHVTERHVTNISCNQGVITRIFTATDDFGRTSTCTQRITVVGNGGNGNNINWPNNVTINECMSNNTHPDQTGYPQWGNSDCSLLAWSYRDEVYRFADGGCVKILRYWKVLDWCIYDPETGYGLYSDIQVIKVTDDNAPVMEDNCEDKNFCTTAGNGCEGYIDYHPTFDDCTPQTHLEYNVRIDLFSDGTVDRINTTGNLSGNYPFGTHTIRWNVNDGCGNTFKCTNTITVSDCKKPTAVCYHGISTVLMPESGMLGLSIKFFDRNSFDNCTPNSKLRFSFSPDVNDTIKFYNCDMLGPDTIQMWVTDQAGNQNYCTTYVDMQDNMGACPSGATTMVSGLVTTTDGEAVRNSHVTISHSGMSQQLISTDEEGYYEYASRLGYTFSNVQVRPFKNNDVLNGVTSYDLYVIYKVLQGKITLDDAAQMIAADINNDGKINNQDILQLRQLLLGVYNQLPENTSWVFANDETGFDQSNPFNYESDAYVSFPGATSTNFTGIKVADLNGTVVSGLQAEFRNNEALTLIYDDVMMTKGETYEVVLSTEGAAEVQSFQLYMDQLDQSVEILDQVLSTEGSLAWHTLSDQSFSVVMVNDVATEYNSEAFITIKVKSNVNGKLSEHLSISAERMSLVADHSGSEREIKLRCGDYSITNTAVSTFPNPVIDEWNLKVDAIQAGTLKLNIYSADGKLVGENTYELYRGRQYINVDNIKTLNKGIYFYKAVIDNQSFTGNIVKM